MILYGYGCSWTEGEGCNVKIENTILNRTLKKEFRNKNSWIKFLSDKLNLECINNSFSGNSNNKIFNDVEHAGVVFQRHKLMRLIGAKV